MPSSSRRKAVKKKEIAELPFNIKHCMRSNFPYFSTRIKLPPEKFPNTRRHLEKKVFVSFEILILFVIKLKKWHLILDISYKK